MTSRNPLHGLPAEVKARLRKRAQPRWVAPTKVPSTSIRDICVLILVLAERLVDATDYCSLFDLLATRWSAHGRPKHLVLRQN
jgi:hypothetical protein